jgi:hypothetical protein
MNINIIMLTGIDMGIESLNSAIGHKEENDGLFM